MVDRFTYKSKDHARRFCIYMVIWDFMMIWWSFAAVTGPPFGGFIGTWGCRLEPLFAGNHGTGFFWRLWCARI